VIKLHYWSLVLSQKTHVEVAESTSVPLVVVLVVLVAVTVYVLSYL
jgi:hypothetical protein